MYLNLRVIILTYNAGLGNVLPAGHMRPEKHHNVARKHIFRLIED